MGSETICRKIARVEPFQCFKDEFSELVFIVHKFHDFFDGLIGLDILNPINAIIDINNSRLNYNKKFLTLHFDRNAVETFVKYQHSIPPNLESYYIEPTDINSIHKNISDLNSEEKSEITKVLKHYDDLFFRHNDVLTFTNAIKHRIFLSDDRPIYCRSYRYPEIYKNEVNKQISDLLNQGIIRPSRSPYSSPLWIVPKKDDSDGNKQYRLVVDYRKLNELTVSDKFPIPNMDDILDKLGNSNYFSTIDLAKGFYQIEIYPDDISKTAFSTSQGHFEWVRMPFGLKNAPATFQRLMNSVLAEYIGKICFVYLDDIIIFSTSLEEHMISIKKVFQRLREAKLKIQPDKCQFLKKETAFLGHIVTTNGVLPNPAKIAPIINYSIPKTHKQIRQFLGMIGFYRKFIRDCAKISKPLTMCLKNGAKVNYNDEEFIHAVNTLKKLITSHPILQYPDFSQTFVITTDASKFAIGAVLSQKGRPICFASRTLNESETRYSVIEKEMLAIVWAVKYFKHYVYGRHFIIETDHKPLLWLRTLKDSSEVLERLKIKIAGYDFEIKYIKGKLNFVADALSRDPQPVTMFVEDMNEVEISTEATMHSALEDNLGLIEISSKPINVFRTQLILKDGALSRNVKTCSGRKIIVLTYPQYSKAVCEDILRNQLPPCSRIALFMDKLEEFIIFQDAYNEIKPSFKIIRCTKILPEIEDEAQSREVILKEHIRLNHRGINNIISEIKEQVFIPKLKSLVTSIVNNCAVCNISKYERHPLKIPYKITETPSKPKQIYHIDIWYPTKGKYYLSCIDKYSKFACLVNITTRNWIAIKDALANIFLNMGVPKLIISDHEKALQTESIKNFLDEHNVRLHLGTPDNKSSNADVERLHSTLNEHIRTINVKPNHEKQFDDPILEAIFVYNRTTHSTTLLKPIELHNETDDEVLRSVYERILKWKQDKIEKLNTSRVDRPADYKHLKNHKRYKLDNLYKNVSPQDITNTHARIGNKN